MTFTIAVERKSSDEQFTANDIKLFHQECGGGEITISGKVGGWGLYCRRCQMEGSVERSGAGTVLFIDENRNRR